MGDEINGGVNTTEGRNIDGLTANSSLRSDTGGVLTGASVHDGIAQNLDGVGSGQEVDDLESVAHDADSHQLLTVVATVHHEGVGHTLNDGALGLAESLLLIATSSVGKILLELGLLVDRDVVLYIPKRMKVRKRFKRSSQEFLLLLGLDLHFALI